MHQTCLECGARLGAAAEHCDLCGTPVGETAAVPDPALPPETAAETPTEGAADHAFPAPPVSAATDASALPANVFCNQCGWQNPAGARFCSRCGARLQEIAPTPAPPTEVPAAVEAGGVAPDAEPAAPKTTPAVLPPRAPEAPDTDKKANEALERKAVSRQVGIIIGAGFLLVLVLFLVTAVSKMRPASTTTQTVPPATAAPTPAVDAAPLSAQLEEQVRAIEEEIAQREGEARIARQRDLVALYFGAGRLDRAALEQQKIADATGTADDWKRVGDLLYDWMETVPDQDQQRKAGIAGQAIEAYQRVLTQEPDNHDVRTDMATAYLSSNNPMQGVAEVKQVLDADPNHLHARFNYGIMLAMIGRSELSIEQFEHVKTLVEPTSTYYQRADEAIQAIQSGSRLGS